MFTILNTGLITRAALDTEMNTKNVTELSIQPPQLEFLLEDLCRKLNHSLLATSAKRRMFLKVKYLWIFYFAHVRIAIPARVIL